MQAPNNRFLSFLSHFILQFPKTIVIISVLLALLSLFYASQNLKLDTDQDNLMSKDHDYYKRYQHFLKSFGDLETIYVVFEIPKGMESLVIKASRLLVEKIKLRKDYYLEIRHQENTDQLPLLFAEILPVKDYTQSNIIKEPLRFLREKIKEVKKQYPQIPIGVTGRPVLQVDEMAGATQDSNWAGIASFIGVAFIFILFFKQAKRPLLSVLCMALGISWSLGLTTITLGHLNLLSMVFALILIGLGIEYGVHFLFRYQAERAQGFEVEKSIQNTINSTLPAIFTSALASSIAFLSALLTNFLGLKEFGFIAGTGLILCFLAQIITLPALLILFDKKIHPIKTLHPPQLIQIEKILFKTKIPLGIIIVLCLIGIPFVKKVYFEDNLLKLQDPTVESVIYENKITEMTNTSTWVAIFLAKSRDELTLLTQKASHLKTVGLTESILNSEPLSHLLKFQELAFEAGKTKEVEKLELLMNDMKKRYKNSQGEYALYVYPQDNIWQPGKMEAFIKDIRSVDKNVTGTPINVYESSRLMKKGFFLVGLVTIITILFILFAEFKSLTDVLIAMFPLVFGIYWTLCLMGLFNISINLANFFALPILIGTSIDNGLHLIHRYRETNSVKKMFEGTSPAIILCLLTTMIGFGALSFVSHRGLASFGQIMALGSLCCLLASLIVVPLALKLFKNTHA